MVNDLTIYTDNDVQLHASAEELAAVAGVPLAETYPGYRWRVTPHPHPSKPFIDIQLEHGGNAMVGATIKPYEYPSASMLKKAILKIGGELLEMFMLNRRAFNEEEFVARKKNFAGVIVPVGFDDTRSSKTRSTSIILP